MTGGLYPTAHIFSFEDLDGPNCTVTVSQEHNGETRLGSIVLKLITNPDGKFVVIADATNTIRPREALLALGPKIEANIPGAHFAFVTRARSRWTPDGSEITRQDGPITRGTKLLDLSDVNADGERERADEEKWMTQVARETLPIGNFPKDLHPAIEKLNNMHLGVAGLDSAADPRFLNLTPQQLDYIPGHDHMLEHPFILTLQPLLHDVDWGEL